MKFQIIYSIFLLGFNSLASAQTVFDYSLFQTGQNAKEINTKDIFRLEKFDACWDISFKYTLANGNSKTEVVPGDWVVNQLKIKPQNITTYVTEDREIIQLPRPDNLVEGKMFFTPKRSDDPLCEKKNEEMKNSLNLTASVLVSPKNTVANAVVESSDIPSERSPFYDAILLQKMLKNKEKDKVVALLSLYGINKDSLSNNEPLNNHINELFPNNIDSTTTLLVTNTETEKSTGIQGAGPSFVTTLTEALAQFIAKRVKEELTLAYLSRFRAYLEDKNQTIRIGVLLPESYKVMMEVEPYDYTTFWLAMQEGFQDDVAQFPENTMGFVRAHKARFKKDDSYAATITGLYLLRGTYRKYSAVAILDGMESLPEVKDFTSENVGASLRTLSLLSRNLHHFENNGSKSEGWIKSNELVALANKQTRDFFAGLLIAKEKEALADIQFKTSSTSLISLRVILLKNYKSPEFNKTLVDLLTQLNVLLDKEKQVGKESEQIEDETNTKKKVKTTFEKYETYAKALLDLVDHSREWVRKLAPENLKTIQVKQTLNAFSVITQATIDLTKHMSEKRYNLAFFDVMRLLKEVQGKHFNETIDTALALAGKPEKQKQLLENLSRLGISDADLSKLTDSEIQIARTNLKSIPIDKKEKLEQQVEKINNSMGALQNLLSPIAAGTSIDTATL